MKIGAHRKAPSTVEPVELIENTNKMCVAVTFNFFLYVANNIFGDLCLLGEYS